MQRKYPVAKPQTKFFYRTIIAAAVGLILSPLSALAEDEPATPSPKRDKTVRLLEKLRDKGIITEEEFNEVAGETGDESATARAERRRKALLEAQEENKAEARKEQFAGRYNNGINFQSGDGRNAFSIGGRIHADYRNFSENTSADTFDLRRAYLTLQGKWNEYLTWDLTGDLANLANNSPLDVAWINIAYNDAMQFRFGQFKMPFSLEELTSSRFIDFQERSLVNGLVPQKERGFMMHGVPYPGLTYGLALSTGQGKNNNDIVAARAKADVIGRATINIAEFAGLQANSVFHFGGAFSTGDLPTGFGLSQRTEGRGITFFTTQAFTGQDVSRNRLGGEVAIAYGPLKLQGEYVSTNFSGSSITNVSYDRNIQASYVEFLWMLTGERYAETYRNGVFGRVVPIQNYTPGGSGAGSWELGLRFSSYDASDFTTANAAGTGRLTAGAAATNVTFAAVSTNKVNALTAQLKWIWNPNLKFYLNYVDTKFDTPVTENPNYGGRANFMINREKAITFRAAYDF